MKAKLTFDLNNIDDITSYHHAVFSTDYSIALWDIRQLLFKYNKMDLSEKEEEIFEKIKRDINQIFEDNNINVNKLN